MKTNFEFWNLSFTLIILRLLDAYLTYTITPDLSSEANPLVTFIDQGWNTLLLVNFFVIALSILLLYISLYFPTNSYPKEKNYSFKEFISHYLYNDKVSFHKIYFYVPHNRKTILNFCGFLFPRVFISWSIIVIIHNLSLIHSTTYQYYLVSWNLWLYLYPVLIPLTLYYFWKFFKIEYEKYIEKTKYQNLV